MNGIDDWYLDHAHRNELAPGYSPDDDIPDPYVVGEFPRREWALAGSRKRSRTRKAVKPLNEVRDLPPAIRGGPWTSAAEKWLTDFPQGTNRECLRALTSAGHVGATTQLIERLRKELPKSRARIRHRERKTPAEAAQPCAPHRGPSPAPRLRQRPKPVPTPQTHYCGGCGLAVGDDGRCRC